MASTTLSQCFYEDNNITSIPINIVLQKDYEKWNKEQSNVVHNWLQASDFKAKATQYSCIPDEQGNVASILVIANQDEPIWTLGNCSHALPAKNYHIASTFQHDIEDNYFLGWALGSYRFQDYKKTKCELAKLSIEEAKDKKFIQALAESVILVRDMVNTPASDMMPQDIAKHIESLANKHKASVQAYVGDELIKQNYPVIHAVGRASIHPPQLLELRWGNVKHPKVTLVGKGVSFDSGGLNIKSGAGMRLMKKDMGGAAHVLGLANAIMHLKLPIQLHVLVPAVENAISGNAYRPGDVIFSRSGKSIEIDNTDAEGRLILCDALTKAIEDEPELLIDFATLTGAARVALGTEVPAFFTNDKIIAEELSQASETANDLVWQLPLHTPYRHMLNSDAADIVNSASSGFGGAITAALFLKDFVPDTSRWVHFDVMAWNNRNRSGRPKGGEAMGLRAVIKLLQQRYS